MAIRSLAGEKVVFGLAGRDRAFALRLLRETMVWRARLDRALARYCSRPLEKLDPVVLAGLRVGAVQLLILGTPSHAAVSETVTAVSPHRGAGMVNAVLRKLAERGEPDPGSATLAERWSHPPALVDRWVSRFGAGDAVRLMEWNNSVPSLGGCVDGSGTGLSPGKYLDDYRIVERTGGNPLDSLDGPVYLQDEAAAVTGRACAVSARGGRVLELGAAPGGKTHHLQETASLVVSMDSSPSRMERWAENRRRLGWRNSVPVAGDGILPPFSSRFDMVMVDAPCTNTGVYRRRPDARWRWSVNYLREMTALQRELLDSAARLVERGGTLVYSTCSLEDEENIRQVDRFERTHTGFRRVELAAPPELVTDGMIIIFPPEHQIDGLFAAAWRNEL